MAPEVASRRRLLSTLLKQCLADAGQVIMATA